jgi:hypothetical protein
MELAAVTVGVLATWRVTHLLVAEDGPWNLVVALRAAAGAGWLARLLDCFYCLSLWIAAPVAALLAATWTDGLLLWLACSGGACAIERALPPRARIFEDPHADRPDVRED